SRISPAFAMMRARSEWGRAAHAGCACFAAAIAAFASSREAPATCVQTSSVAGLYTGNSALPVALTDCTLIKSFLLLIVFTCQRGYPERATRQSIRRHLARMRARAGDKAPRSFARIVLAWVGSIGIGFGNWQMRSGVFRAGKIAR